MAKVLFVDDEECLVYLAKDMLTGLGYECGFAYRGKQALELLENGTYDVLLTDVNMPEMDGWELTAIVKKKYPSLPIIVSSGFIDRLPSKSYDATLILPKPYSIKDLQTAIHGALKIAKLEQMKSKEENAGSIAISMGIGMVLWMLTFVA